MASGRCLIRQPARCRGFDLVGLLGATPVRGLRDPFDLVTEPVKLSCEWDR
jgi:hypothetical protein